MAEDATHVLLPSEAELLTQTVEAFDFELYGSKKWWAQHEVVEKLNMQAIINVSSEADEFVKEFLVSHNKIKVLIYDLLISELWTEKLFPFIKENVDINRSSLPLYMALFHETTTCGLLETSLYYKECCESAGDDIVDLIDYVNRKLTTLLLRIEEGEKPSDDASDGEELSNQNKTIQFSIYMKCLSILRYLSDALEEISLSALTRILNTHDFPCLLVQILDLAPWKRKDGND